MINLYSKQNLIKITNVEELKKEDINKTWVHLTTPTKEEIDKIHTLTNINKNLLIKSLDEEEIAHIESEDDTTLIVVDTVYNEDKTTNIVTYNTIPFCILVNDNYIVTTCLKDEIFIDELIDKQFSNIQTNKKITLILMLLFYNAQYYINTLKIIEKSTQQIEKKLNHDMKNEGLLETLHLSKTLVYLSTSISSNLIVITKLEKLEKFKEYPSDIDLLEDTIIESNQAKETCKIFREILNTKMDVYASIINNNVNSVMKLLAIITIIVTIPTLIASMYGMNVKLPLQDSPYGFLIVIISSIVLSILGTIALLKFTNKKYNDK